MSQPIKDGQYNLAARLIKQMSLSQLKLLKTEIELFILDKEHKRSDSDNTDTITT